MRSKSIDTKIFWAERIPTAKIRRLYKMHSMGIVTMEDVDDVGIALLLRCESIQRVTHRLCPNCGNELKGAWDGQNKYRIITCVKGDFSCTWTDYHSSYKKDRLHGGRALPAFENFLREYVLKRNVQEKMICIDILIHSVHESLDKKYTKPGAHNLLRGRNDEVKLFLDDLAGVVSQPSQARRQFLRKMNRL